MDILPTLSPLMVHVPRPSREDWKWFHITGNGSVTEAPGEPERGGQCSSWAGLEEPGRKYSWGLMIMALAPPMGSPSYPYRTTQSSGNFGSKRGKKKNGQTPK